MDSDKTTTVEEAFLDALDVLWRQHGNDDPCYKAMLPFAKQIAELQAECNEQARLNGMGAEREARLMAQVAELRAERDALAKDAARYRWLIESGKYCPAFGRSGWALRAGGFVRSSKYDLDAAIDAAMAEG